MSRVYSVESAEVEKLIVIPELPPAILVKVCGTVPTTGWTDPQLSPWIYIVPPKDGILDLDFNARPPTGIVLQVFTTICLSTTLFIPDWVRGVRVHSSTNAIEAKLPGGKNPPEYRQLAPVLPWPWFVPNASRQ